jgi:aryl-alcohol dehydrogenase-like predicted oxidoreductase
VPQRRKLGTREVNPIGLGCMSLSLGYGTPPQPAQSNRLLNAALDLGYDMFDTAPVYGNGANEELIGTSISHRRSEFLLATKCGMTGFDGQHAIDGRPEVLQRSVEESLRRLRTDVIDLLYLHRWDKSIPIEESVGAMATMVSAGKVRAIGLSEVSADTLRKAHRVHPIAVVQSEYSPWSRDVELGLLAATHELGVAFAAFSPVGRGFLAGKVVSSAQLEDGDIRRSMPRFQPENISVNLSLADRFRQIAQRLGCTPAQLSLGWVLARRDNIVAIPGTTSLQHLRENFAASTIVIPADAAAEIERLFASENVAGTRYPNHLQAQVDTEDPRSPRDD